MNVGFVGLGVMGAPMAGHLVEAGRSVVVWNRTAAKAAPLAEAGARTASSLRALAAECSTVCLCVTRTEDVELCLAELVPAAAPGTLFIDHSTIAPEAAKRLGAELAADGLRFVDAPITGGSMGAKSGRLTIFCGGEEAAVAEAIEVVRPYAKTAARVGPNGAGQLMKMANQVAVGGALLGLCESLSFAARAGLDLSQAFELLGGGAGGSWAFANYGPKLLSRDWSPGFSIANQRKDFGYCEAAADDIGAMVPATRLADELLGRLEAAGRGGDTTAALFDLYMANA